MSDEPSTLKILVCEDDPGILEVVGIALKSEGFEAIPCGDTDKLVEAAKAVRPRIVLLDLWLRGSDGEELIERLRAEPLTSDIKIVLMSGNSNLPEIAARNGVDFLPKPFSLEDLKNAIERNLRA